MNRLKEDFINSIPQPVFIRLVGSKDWYPLHDICVETGCLRFDVCGRLQPAHIGDAGMFKDESGTEYFLDEFYSDFGLEVL